MNRITPQHTKELFQTLRLLPAQNVFYKKRTACLIAALYAEKYGLREMVRTGRRLASGEISYRQLADELDLDREFIEGILAGWDGTLLPPDAMATDAEQTEAGFEDGTSCWSAVNGW